jgi:hypothetical protein
MCTRRGRCLEHGGGQLRGAASALPLTLIHRSAWKWNSRKSISTILNISPYRAGAMRHLAGPMDRMLPQDVVDLDRNSMW